MGLPWCSRCGQKAGSKARDEMGARIQGPRIRLRELDGTTIRLCQYCIADNVMVAYVMYDVATEGYTSDDYDGTDDDDLA